MYTACIWLCVWQVTSVAASVLVSRDHTKTKIQHQTSSCVLSFRQNSRSWMTKTTNRIFFSSSGSQTILVFPYQSSWQYADWEPLTGASSAGVVGTNRDSGRIAGYRSMTATVCDPQLTVSVRGYLGAGATDRRESLHDGWSIIRIPDRASPLLVVIYLVVTKCETKKGRRIGFWASKSHFISILLFIVQLRFYNS